GLDSRKNSVVSIGAVDFDDPTRQFYEECRVFEGAEIDDDALAVNGFTREQCLDKNKKTLREVMTLFKAWIDEAKGDKILAGQNAFYDRDILNESFKRSAIDFQFHFRILELHSIAYFDFVKRGFTPPTEDGLSALSLDRVLNYVGLPQEPRPHNALVGAKMEAEAISRIFYGKNLLEEYSKYDIPEKFISL
ncbi:3'-5' exoribonuclease, partial [Candidatus Azambacteria bacterium]|nr:3'-5' exoribonuclease [Candidatus Azambacteria bacterium]